MRFATIAQKEDRIAFAILAAKREIIIPRTLERPSTGSGRFIIGNAAVFRPTYHAMSANRPIVGSKANGTKKLDALRIDYLIDVAINAMISLSIQLQELWIEIGQFHRYTVLCVEWFLARNSIA